MERVIFCLLTGLCLMASSLAQAYKPPKVDEPVFDLKRLALMEVERQKLATNLAGYVVNEVPVQSNGHYAEWARKMLGLALVLDGRNRSALVANHQFNRGVEPKKVATDYSAAALANLILAQAKLLIKTGGDENVYVAGLFLSAAVEMDPKNEDAVYELELYKLDIGLIDWEPITDGKSLKKKKAVEEKVK